MRILFLDDARVRHDAFALAHGGDEVLHVFTAAEATRALDLTARFDLVHLDHDLAEEHYLELSGGLRETPATGDLPYEPGTGMDVVVHVLRMAPERRPVRVVVHSHNAIAEEMVARLEQAGVPASWARF
jgi:CheY-like chemotaxis protein